MIGKTIGHYRIEEKLAEGGMGVVYKAVDTNLRRPVALKFLPAELTSNVEFRKRFIHEAQAASALDHINICNIHEIAESNEGQTFIVMTCYEGKTLKEKIKRGPLNLKEALDIIIQVAEGLTKAHEKRIVHRDIKPANIMVTDENVVKILDFGLAKLYKRTKLTKSGTALGTAAYMSPEQIKGKTVDHRADIWAVGIILYEMLTCQLPFRGEYDQALFYSILNEEPEHLTALRSGIPMELERIVNKLLSKEPDARYQHIDELTVDLKKLDLSAIFNTRNSPGTPTSHSTKDTGKLGRLVPWTVAAIAALAAFTTLWRPFSVEPDEVRRWNLNLPESARISPIGSTPLAVGGPALALSRDGTKLVFVGESGVETQLYLRELNQFRSIPIAGTKGAYNPFFSPDGRWVGFFSGNKLKKISLTGGAPVTLCRVINPYGASWGSNDLIVYSGKEGGSLYRISINGGTPELLAESGPGNYSWPEFLPDGKTVLTSGIRVVSAENGWQKSLNIAGNNPRFSASGHLLFSRYGRVMAVPFDPRKLETVGAELPLPDSVRTEINGVAQFSVSDDGTFIYIPGLSAARSSLVWADREGLITPLPFPVEYYGTFQLSPDGIKLAVQLFEGGTSNIWIYDLTSGNRSKLTLEGFNSFPIWSPDGQWVTFFSRREGAERILMQSTTNTSEIRELIRGNNAMLPTSWSSEREFLLMDEASNNYDIVLLDNKRHNEMGGFASTRFIEWGATFSPDSRFVAYTSDEQGQYEVFVQPYPQTGEKWQISSEGGEEPVWSIDTDELFYRNGKKIMAVTFSAVPSFEAARPRVLFEGDFVNVGGRSYDAAPDGNRFLLLKSRDVRPAYTHLNAISNWHRMLDMSN